MAQFSTSQRVLSLIALAFLFMTTYLLTSRTHLSSPSIEHLKAAVGDKWDHGISRLMINRQPAGQSPGDLEVLINKLVEAKLVEYRNAAVAELRKRQDPTNVGTGLGGLLGSLTGAGGAGAAPAAAPGAAPAAGDPAPAASSGGISGLLGSLTSGLGGGVADSLGTTAGPLGQGLAQGTIDGLKLPTNAGVNPPSNSGIAGAAQSLGEGLSSTFTSEVNTSALMQGGNTNLPAAARGLATGLSNGTAMGTKLTMANLAPPMDPSMDPAAIAGNFGFGLTNTFFSNVNLNMAASPQQMQMVMRQIAATIGPTASGLGQGTAAGLKLSTVPLKDQVDPNNVQGPALAHDFSQTLSSSFLGSVNLAALAPNPAQSAMTMQMIFAALPGVGTGIGTGTAQGLGLAKAAAGPPVVPTDFNTGSQEFSRSLTSSFWGSLDVSKLIALQGAAGGGGGGSMSSMIGPAAEGLGKGLGEGTAVGLGLKAASPQMPINGMDTSAVTEAFSKNLVASFLANGTVQKLAADAAALSAVSAGPPIVVSKVTEGFGRGLVEGLQSGLGMNTSTDTFDDSVMGGSVGFGRGLSEGTVMLVSSFVSDPSALSSLGINGLVPNPSTAAPNMAPVPALPPSPKSPPPATNPASPNSPPPAANPASPNSPPPASNPASPNSPPPATNPASPNSPPPAANPSPAAAGAPAGGPMAAPAMPAKPAMPMGGDASTSFVQKRQDNPDAAPPPMDAAGGFAKGLTGLNLTSLNTTAITEQLIANMNITQTNEQLQKGLDQLTCTGFGGIWSLAQGLTNSGFFPTNPLKGGKPVPGFGNTTFTVTQNKNTFTSAPGLGESRTNGILVPRQTLIMVIHSVFGSIAFFTLMPIVLMLAGAHDITRMIGRPNILANSPRLQLLTQMIAFVPFSIVTLVTGFIVSGHNVNHFNTPHKGFGYFLVLFGFIWVVTSRIANTKPGPMKAVNNGVVGIMLILAVVAYITGWNDLATSSLCLTQIVSADAYIGLGLLVGGTFSNALAVMGLVILIGKWIGTTPQRGSVEKGDIRRVNSPTPREIRRISGPFLPEARDYSR